MISYKYISIWVKAVYDMGLTGGWVYITPLVTCDDGAISSSSEYWTLNPKP